MYLGILDSFLKYWLRKFLTLVPFVQITVPLLETLVTEMRKARDRNLPYDFKHFIMISKLYKTKNLANGMQSDPDMQVKTENRI